MGKTRKFPPLKGVASYLVGGKSTPIYFKNSNSSQKYKASKAKLKEREKQKEQ